MPKYTKTIQEYIAEKRNIPRKDFLTEGIGDTLRRGIDKAKSYIKGIFDSFTSLFVKNREITEGPKAGTQLVEYFDSNEGSILTQLRNAYSGTDYANTVKPSKQEIMDGLVFENEKYDTVDVLNEGEISMEWTGKESAVRNVAMSELKNIIRLQYEKTVTSTEGGKGRRAKPTFIFGAPGIGKTEGVAQVADELGIDMIVLSVALMAKEDFVGLPYVEETGDGEYTTKVSKMAQPTILPKEGTRGGILFMDEFNAADEYVIKSLLTFIQDGRVNDYVLPMNWIIVAAGNRTSESPVLEIENQKALISRFRFVNYVADRMEWAKWAVESNKKHGTEIYNSYVIDFLISQFGENFFYDLDEDTSGAYPTPRSWTEFARELNQEVKIITGSGDIGKYKPENIRELAIDMVGVKAANSFMEYISILRFLTKEDVDKILVDWKSVPKIKNAEMYNTSGAVKPILMFAMASFFRKEIEKILETDTTFDTKYKAIVNGVNYMLQYNSFDPVMSTYFYLVGIAKTMMTEANSKEADAAFVKFGPELDKIDAVLKGAKGGASVTKSKK